MISGGIVMGIGTIVGIPIPAGGGIGRYLESFHGASSEIPSPKSWYSCFES